MLERSGQLLVIFADRCSSKCFSPEGKNFRAEWREEPPFVNLDTWTCLDGNFDETESASYGHEHMKALSQHCGTELVHLAIGRLILIKLHMQIRRIIGVKILRIILIVRASAIRTFKLKLDYTMFTGLVELFELRVCLYSPSTCTRLGG